MNPLDKLRFQDYFDKNLYLGTLAEIIDFTSPDSGGTYLISGGQVIWESGLTFRVTAATYMINGVPYFADEQTHTLSAADPTLGRRDTFYLDDSGGATNDPDTPATSGDFGAVTGTPASNPQEPSVDPETQIRLVDVLIPAGAIEPGGVSSANIYDENVGTAGGEWDTFTNNSAQVDFDATVDPFANTKHIHFAGDGSSAYMRFTDSSAANYDTEAKLVFSIKPIDKMKTQHYISIQLQDTGGDDYRFTNLRHGLHGFDGNTSEWQVISIPLSDFGFQQGSPPLQLDRLYFNIGPSTRSKEFYIDDVYIQTGLPQPPEGVCCESKVGNTLFVDTEYGNDSTAERENFDKPYATASAAEDDAQSGDTIVFRAGIHTLTASLGKGGVSYYNSAGSILQPASDLFDDVNSAMTIKFVNDGFVETDSVKLAKFQHADSIFYMHGNGGNQTGSGSSTMFHNAGGTMYLNLNRSVQTNNGSVFLLHTGTAPKTSCLINDLETTASIARINTGVADITWNKAKSSGTSGDSGQSSAFTTGTAVLRIVSGHWKADAAVSIYSAMQPNGGKIYFEGIVEYENSSTGWVDVANMVGAGTNSELHLRNARLVNKSITGSNSSSVIRLDEDITNRLIIENSKLINESPLATGHGINVYQTLTPTPTEEVISIQDTSILLNSTGVGLGAKAIRKLSGTLNYKALTDIRSNGSFDGTNLLSSTIGIVDSEVKSD